MIILDTNIISEMMRTAPSEQVITWIDQQHITELFITTITIAEISYGLNISPKGKHRYLLENIFNKTILDTFQHRILPFSESAAHIYGKIMGLRKELERPLSIPDGQIAAIARTHNATVATRNIRDFADCELDLINPFDE